LRFKSNEKRKYKELNLASSIKFPIPVNLELPAHKVSLIIQSQLGGVALPTDEKSPGNGMYMTEVALVFQHVTRLIRCIIDIELCLEDSVSLRSALMLCRSLGARCWDDSPLQLKQIERIGPVGVRRLVNANVNSIDALENTEAHKIEAILTRAPPFGLKILDEVRAFPKLRVSMKMTGKPVRLLPHLSSSSLTCKRCSRQVMVL
jgi:ATP-dependent DNA helicase HFM1/MER3